MYCISLTREANELLRAFQKNIIKTFGKPSSIYADNEPSLLSNVFTEFCNEHNIEINTCSPHSAFSNGIAEKTVGLCKESIRLLTKQTGQTWLEMLPFVNIALNTRKLK